MNKISKGQAVSVPTPCPLMRTSFLGVIPSSMVGQEIHRGAKERQQNNNTTRCYESFPSSLQKIEHWTPPFLILQL